MAESSILDFIRTNSSGDHGQAFGKKEMTRRALLKLIQGATQITDGRRPVRGYGEGRGGTEKWENLDIWKRQARGPANRVTAWLKERTVASAYLE